MSDCPEVNVIHTGDAFDLLDELPESSVHACVTDPPYGLAFMGRSWDDFEPREYQQWCEEWAREVNRVLRPGGHLLAFSGNRTHHRLFSGVEDAGFEIRDTITWHYGSGFPKALDVSKAIDKRAGVEPEAVSDAEGVVFMNDDDDGWNDTHTHIEMGDPTTDAAREWDGWKTALKPATEYVVVARKPFDSTVAECMQEYGTGAMNIEACRVGKEELEYETTINRGGVVSGDNTEKHPSSATGRYPANVVFDETQADTLDREVGETSSCGGNKRDGDKSASKRYDTNGSTDFAAQPGQRRGDSGGPSRYFYTSKASRSERTLDGRIDNAHPTVKPQDLMEWLVKLVTAEEQIVLDPFAGSGTTCRAAKDINRRFVGIEQQAKWADVARVRCGLTPNDPSTVRDSDSQQGLEAFTDGGIGD